MAHSHFKQSMLCVEFSDGNCTGLIEANKNFLIELDLENGWMMSHMVNTSRHE